jgi:hypothetical protein
VLAAAMLIAQQVFPQLHLIPLNVKNQNILPLAPIENPAGTAYNFLVN